VLDEFICIFLSPPPVPWVFAVDILALYMIISS
jgi:hypothetical protein